jgi:hypothetical protein
VVDAEPLDQAEMTILGHCVEDYCGSGELFWALQRLVPDLSNRAVLVRRGAEIIAKLLGAGLIAAYIRSPDPAAPYTPAEGDADVLAVAVERDHLVSPDDAPKQTYWFAATPSGVSTYFAQRPQPPA